MNFTTFLTVQKLTSLISFACNWFLAFLRVQLLLFLVALPILSLWGLPLSYASILGNLLFAPWATVFLGLSTLWLLSYLWGLPTTFLVYCIERLVAWWLWCLSWGSSRMLFAVPAVHPFIAIIIPITGVLVLYSNIRHRWGSAYEVLLLGCLAWGWCYVMSTWAISRIPVPVAHGGGNVWLCPTYEGVNLVDKEGVLRNLGPSSSWITFSLACALARNFGACSCQNIVISKPTIPRLNAAASLIEAGKAKRLMIPSWVIQKKWFINWKKGHGDVEVVQVEL